MEVVRSPALHCVECILRALPDVGAQQFCGLVVGAEAETGELVVGDLERVDCGRSEGAAVEDEHDCVVPWSVWCNPVDAEERANLDVQAEFFA